MYSCSPMVVIAQNRLCVNYSHNKNTVEKRIVFKIITMQSKMAKVFNNTL